MAARDYVLRVVQRSSTPLVLVIFGVAIAPGPLCALGLASRTEASVSQPRPVASAALLQGDFFLSSSQDSAQGSTEDQAPVAGLPDMKNAGDGPGRPLYQFNTVELPENPTGKRCISARMDKFTHSLSIDAGEQDLNSVAYGCVDDMLDETGWSSLEVSTIDDDSVPLVTRAYAAGVVEGLLTAPRMTQFHKNVQELLIKDTGGGSSLAAVDRVIRMALVAWEEFAGADAGVEPKDDLPRQAWAALIQMRGIRDGNNFVAGLANSGVDELSAYQIMLMNMHAEIPAIVELYSHSAQAQVSASFLGASSGAVAQSTSWERWSAHTAHGSAIVRRLGPRENPEDLLAGHVTFGDYGEMHRTMKHYNLNFKTLIKGVSMTSYPGCIGSTDDYIINDKGFVLMSTSLWVPPDGEYAQPAATNEGLPSFLRTLMATRTAIQPRMWAHVYQYIPGIAGAKQWLIANYGVLKEQQPIANDTLWMVESLPRLQRSGDVSHALRDNGFFEAHGVPHFADIREIYGLPRDGPGGYEEHRLSALVDKGATIGDLASARQVLTEMAPSRDAQIPITTRNDLDTSRPIPAGGIDAKVTSKCMVQKLACQAISGPPKGVDGTPFSWLDANGGEKFVGWPRMGLPDAWDFPWVNMFKGASPSAVTPDMAECVPAAS